MINFQSKKPLMSQILVLKNKERSHWLLTLQTMKVQKHHWRKRFLGKNSQEISGVKTWKLMILLLLIWLNTMMTTTELISDHTWLKIHIQFLQLIKLENALKSLERCISDTWLLFILIKVTFVESLPDKIYSLLLICD